MCQETVLKLLEDVNENKAAGLDNLSRKFLKDGETVLAKPISYICNLSIKYSNDYLKKKYSKTVPKNYLPISLLLLVSEIIEKVIHDQTQNFPDKNNIIHRYPPDFSSIDLCLSNSNNKIATSLKSGLHIGITLIEKAFDSVK